MAPAQDTKYLLMTVLSTEGQRKLAEALDISASEVSRKINGDSGFTIEQLAKGFDLVGAKILPRDENLVVVSKAEYSAIRLLAHKQTQCDDE